MPIAAKIGCTPQRLNDWVKKAEVDSGQRAGIPTEMAERMKALERENREQRQVNEILREASAYFAMAELDHRRSDGGFHRRAPGCARGRADLPSPWSSDQWRTMARCCRSPRPPTTIIWRSGPIRQGGRIVPAGTRRCAPRSGVSSRRTGASTACARSGTVRAMPSNRWRAGPHRREGFDVARLAQSQG